MRRIICCAAAVAATALAGCNRPAPKPAPAPAAATSDVPLKEFMAHVMQSNAEQFWRWQGFVMNEKGTRTFEPKNDEEWEQAESAALTLVELSYTLQQPDRRRAGTDNWDKRVADFRQVASRAAAAAEKHDVKTFSAAADDLTGTCAECHYAFAPGLEPPRPAQ